MKTSFVDLRQSAWVVYRVTTQSSVYLLGLHEHDGRRFAVARGQLGTAVAGIIVRDSEPRIAGRLLWNVPCEEWVGHPLEIGTMTTSPIAAVVVETDTPSITAVTQVGLMSTREGRAEPVRRAEPARHTPPEYPESHVQYAENAAWLLRAVLRKEALFEDVDGQPLLRQRLHLALADCVLQLESLRGRLGR